MVVWSNDEKEKAMRLYPVSRQYDSDVKWNEMEIHPYSEIESQSDVLLKLMTPGYEREIRFDPG